MQKLMFRGVLRINENPNYLKMHSAGLLYPSTSKQSMHGISERRRKSSQLFALLESKQSNLNHLEKKLHFIILAKNTSSLSRRKSGLKTRLEPLSLQPCLLTRRSYTSLEPWLVQEEKLSYSESLREPTGSAPGLLEKLEEEGSSTLQQSSPLFPASGWQSPLRPPNPVSG